MSKKKKVMRVKLIANPGAGDASKAAENMKLAVDCLKNNGMKVDVALAKPKEKATPIAKKAAKDGYKIVVALGGDGTIEAVMRGLIGTKTRLGIIRAGTQNNIAKSLGIPEDMEQACALIASKKKFKLDVGQVKTKKGEKLIFFELATVGLSAALYPHASKVADGKLSSLKDAAAALIHQETRPKVYLTMNGESKIKVETMLAVISNTPIFGKNFMVAPDASVEDGLLDISVYPDFSKAELLRYYAAVMDGGYSGDGKVQHYQARKVKIKTSPKLDVMADGILLGKGTVRVKVLPGALRVITEKVGKGLEIMQSEPQKAAPEKAASEPAPVSDKNQTADNSVITLG